MKKYKMSLLALGLMLNLNFAFGQLNVVNSDELGRLLDLQYDKEIPNRVYAHSNGGHIMQSQDNGQTWQVKFGIDDRVLDHFSIMNDNKHLVFSSRSNNDFDIKYYNIQSGTIVKTLYPPIPSGSTDASIRTMDVQDLNTLIVGVVYKMGGFPQGKVYKSVDGGQNWTEIYNTIDHDYAIFDNIKFDPTNSNKILIGLSNGPTDSEGGLMISTDGGQSWEKKLDDIKIKPIEFKPGNSNEIWVGSAQTDDNTLGVFKSLDGGQNWELVPFEWHPFAQNSVTAIKFNPQNANHIIILEENEYLTSWDGGQTWEQSVNVDPDIFVDDYYFGTNISYNPFNLNELFINSNYYAMKSENKGSSYNRLYLPYFSSEGNVNLTTDVAGNKILYYGYQLGIAKQNLETGEVSFIDTLPVNKMRLQPGAFLHIDRNNPGRLFTLSTHDHSEDGAVLLKVSDDGGETMHALTHNMFRNEFNSVGLFPNNLNKVIVSLSSYGGSANLVEIDYSDLNNPIINELQIPNFDGTRIMYIDVDSTNENHLTVSQGARIYKTTDKGQNWTQISSGLEDLVDYVEDWDYETMLDLIVNVAKDPLNDHNLVMATTKGIYKSTNKGDNWTKIHDKFTNRIHISDKTAGHIVAATYFGSGEGITSQLHFTNDNGANWTTFDLVNHYYIQTANIFTSTDVEFFDNYAHVYISTSDLGVVRYDVDLTNLTVSDPVHIGTESLQISPNPTSDFIHLNSAKNVDDVEIFNLSGQSIYKGKDTKINVRNFDPGVYILKARLDNGKIISKKFIKK